MIKEITIESIKKETNIKKQYSLIIDYISDYLDKDMKINNYCDFKNNKCIANRLTKTVHKDNGCCYHKKEGLCKNLKNKKCSIECVSCKLFLCSYLENHVIKYKINEIFPIKKFFNKRQQQILEKSFFKTKEEIIELLLEKRKV